MSNTPYTSSALKGASAGYGASLAGATVGASVVAGAATFGIGAAIAAIFGILGHHAAAVRNEASALNQAVPGVEKSFGEIVSNFNAGSLSAADASAAFDETLSQYDKFIHKTAGVKNKAGNGPDVVLKDYLRPWVEKLKALIRGGGGTFTADAIPAHAGFAGTPGFSLDVVSVKQQGSIVGLANSTAAGIPVWVWAIAAIFVLYLIVR